MKLAPAANEIEISLFGPGYGECVLVHLGENRWLIVDSCVDSRAKQVPVLNYLQHLGIDPAESVKLIAVSHWHDDHVRGLSSLIEHCKKADFWLPEAMSSGEFVTLLSTYNDRFSNSTVGAGCRELYEVLRILRESRRIPKRALADMRLYLSPCSDGATPCKVYALSPSQSVSLTAVLSFGEYIKEQEPRGRLLPGKPNHLAMALWIEIGTLRILLGADLEETLDPHTGWSVIVSDSTCAQGRASLFKIPHHGSSTGHCQAVWEALLESKPVALLTPFTRGKKLPTAEDEQRLCSLTDSVYITTLHTPKPPKRLRVVEETVKRMAAHLSPVPYSMGHIRCRLKLDSLPAEWDITLLNDAQQLCS